MSKLLKVGDTVSWRGSWGKDSPKLVKVNSIEVNCEGKNGDEVEAVEWSKVNDRSVILDLDNDHWCYGYQVKKIVQVSA